MRVLIIDDHELFRAGVALLLEELFPGVALLHANTLSQGLHRACSDDLDIVFLDLELPDGHGCDSIAELKEIRPSLPVIVVSADERVETIRRCIERRATGYVPKSSPPEALRAAISAVLAGGVFLPEFSIAELRHHMGEVPASAGRSDNRPLADPQHITDAMALGLTVREFETLAWLVRGLPSKTIASRMGLEDVTVRKYISNLLAHFHLRRRTELIVMLADQGIKLGDPLVTAPRHDATVQNIASRRTG